jgi:hypothetical protein
MVLLISGASSGLGFSWFIVEVDVRRFGRSIDFTIPGDFLYQHRPDAQDKVCPQMGAQLVLERGDLIFVEIEGRSNHGYHHGLAELVAVTKVGKARPSSILMRSP